MFGRSTYHPFRRPRRWYDWLFWLLIPICLALGVYEIVHSKQWAAEKLEREGYTHVVLTGWQPFTLWCGQREGVAQGFTGRDARGENRSGYVCSNLIYSYIVD